VCGTGHKKKEDGVNPKVCLRASTLLKCTSTQVYAVPSISLAHWESEARRRGKANRKKEFIDIPENTKITLSFLWEREGGTYIHSGRVYLNSPLHLKDSEVYDTKGRKKKRNPGYSPEEDTASRSSFYNSKPVTLHILPRSNNTEEK